MSEYQALSAFEQVELQERIAYLEGLVALQDAAIQEADAVIRDYKINPVTMNGLKTFNEAISASAETVQAFRDKLTELLRREVAMLRMKIAIIADNCPHTEYDPDCTGTGNADDAYNHGADMARSAVGGQLRELLDADTQATAQAYEQEVESRGARADDGSLLTWLQDNPAYTVELSDEGEGEEIWIVHKVSGGRNDREWVEAGRGYSIREALRDAQLRATSKKG